MRVTMMLVSIVGLMGWSSIGNAAECIPLGETITHQGNIITIVGEVNPEIKEVCTRLWQKRQAEGFVLFVQEITHLRTLAVEEARIEVLARLERLKVPNISVRSFSSSSVTNDVVNTVVNDLRATQTVR